MALPTGTIKQSEVKAEFNKGNNLRAYLGAAPGVPSSGNLKLTDFRGKSSTFLDSTVTAPNAGNAYYETSYTQNRVDYITGGTSPRTSFKYATWGQPYIQFVWPEVPAVVDRSIDVYYSIKFLNDLQEGGVTFRICMARNNTSTSFNQSIQYRSPVDQDRVNTNSDFRAIQVTYWSAGTTHKWFDSDRGGWQQTSGDRPGRWHTLSGWLRNWGNHYAMNTGCRPMLQVIGTASGSYPTVFAEDIVLKIQPPAIAKSGRPLRRPAEDFLKEQSE